MRDIIRATRRRVNVFLNIALARKEVLRLLGDSRPFDELRCWIEPADTLQHLAECLPAPTGHTTRRYLADRSKLAEVDISPVVGYVSVARAENVYSISVSLWRRDRAGCRIVLESFEKERPMQDSEGTRQWQVTCVCGWRTRGAKEDVVSAVIGHGRDTHDQDVTEEQAMAQLVPMTGG